METQAKETWLDVARRDVDIGRVAAAKKCKACPLLSVIPNKKKKSTVPNKLA